MKWGYLLIIMNFNFVRENQIKTRKFAWEDRKKKYDKLS